MIENILNNYEKVKVGKKEIEIWELKDRIRDGEDQLQIEHKVLEDMTNNELAGYFSELVRKWKTGQKDSATAKIPDDDQQQEKGISDKKESDSNIVDTETLLDQDGGISLDIIQLADNIGKQYGIMGEQICDRYLQICKKTEFDKEAMEDLLFNVLFDIDETIAGNLESWLNAFVRPIKEGVLNEFSGGEEECKEK